MSKEIYAMIKGEKVVLGNVNSKKQFTFREDIDMSIVSKKTMERLEDMYEIYKPNQKKMSKEQEILEKYKALHIGGVSVSLPSVDDAGIIAVEIAEINNEMTAQEQAFFIAGFSECVKYLEMQGNER